MKRKDVHTDVTYALFPRFWRRVPCPLEESAEEGEPGIGSRAHLPGSFLYFG